VLADRTDGSSRVMGRASSPSTRRPEAAAPMRRLPRAGAVHGQPIREPPGSEIRSQPGSFNWSAATAARVGASYE
jgi:hypothetical protein